ncbi:MAG TPA: MMPL family transporter [Solirubrobacteraceae bacterium]|jgi:RND superfamily putative drug exporter|nr:MMPL family transporter [Solirubrobacteraceae bacterium]
MAALAGFVARRPRLVMIVALVTTLVALPLAGKERDGLTSGGTISSSSQSATVSDEIEAGTFPGAEVSPLVVLLAPRPDARPGDLTAAIAHVGARVGKVDGVSVPAAGRRAALAAAQARPGAPVSVPLDYGGGVGIDEAREVTAELGIENPHPGTASGGRVDVHLIGEGALWSAFIQRADEDTRAAETRAFPVIAIVLLVAFGSLLAALLPIVLAAISLIVTSAIIYLLTFATSMDVFAATTASMLGLGVAIDYSLFIIVRYREELRAGLDPDAARSRAMATSGRAVVYSGITVAIAQSALFLIASPGVRSIAAGTIIVVAVSVLVASSVLPVLIAKLGPRAYEPGRLGRWIARRRANRDGLRFWARWTGVVMRRPVLCLVAAVGLLLALAAPILDLTVRNSAINQLPANHQVREGIAIVTEQAGIGVLAPVRIMVSDASGQALDGAAVQRVSDAVRGDPAVRTVEQQQTSTSGDRALVTAVLDVRSDSQAARDAVDRLRDDLPAAAGGGAAIDVGGATAIILDFDRLVTAQLWRPILFVLAASYLVLLVLLRSVVLPLKATLMTLLSVLAAYGALVGVFKYGWLGFLGFEKADTIYPITLPLVFTLCFGLSMDYHIFMLSRIQERFLATGDTRTAVAEALASSATPITNAALIMVVVFLAFVSSGAPSIQQLGFAAAVAIAIDATIVRLVIVPASMVLLGRWNWWLPRPLERVLGTRPVASAGVAGEPAR